MSSALLKLCRSICIPEELLQASISNLMSSVELAQLRSLIPSGRRLLGLDVGQRPLGLALSDIGWSVASPVRTLPRRRLTGDLEAMRVHWLRSWRSAGSL